MPHLSSRRDFLAGLSAATLASALPAWSASTPRPNFVVIFTDDQGYQDVGCFGSPSIRTPRLDRMAAEGARFTDFYTAASVCTPSRAALLTGCYPPRVSLAESPGDVLFTNSQRGLNPDEVTIADLLKAQGYATACVGKWHLGHLPPFLPMAQGFDSYFGIPYSNDMAGRDGVPLMRNEEIIERPADQTTITRRYTEEAVGFIRKNRARPFFLYLPHTMPHTPLAASEPFLGQSKRGLYGDVIETLDWSVGQILDTLDELGLSENTLVVFTSDNGPWLVQGAHGGCALPLRAGKKTTYEGGMREPCIMRWPGTIPAGTTCGEVASTIDLLPTIARLAGTREPTDRIIDGRDIGALLRNPTRAKSPHEAFYYYFLNELQGIRTGRWKYRFPGRTIDEYPYRWRRLLRQGFIENNPTPAALYDLEKDPGEVTNVIEQHPNTAERLRMMAVQFDRELKANIRPVGRIGT